MLSLEMCSKVARAVAAVASLDACGGTVVSRVGNGDGQGASATDAGKNRGSGGATYTGGGTSGSMAPEASVGALVSPEASVGASQLVPCNDGTGKTNCCPPEAPNGACDPSAGGCRTPCSKGMFGDLSCAQNGVWVPYVGLLPCGGVTACNDGTGSTDCCTEGVVEGGGCYDSASRCSPGGCQHGFKSYLYCDGNWIAGKGLFPCGADAGPAEATDSGSAVSCQDGSTQMIQASSYDRSCVLNADCVAVGEGNACNVCPFSCSTAAINVAAKAQYDADVARTPAGRLAGTTFCGCPAAFGPCCVDGFCQAGLLCMPPSP